MAFISTGLQWLQETRRLRPNNIQYYWVRIIAARPFKLVADLTPNTCFFFSEFRVPPIVFLAVGPLPNDPDVYVGRVVDDLNAQGNKRVFFINMKGTLTDPAHDYGCDGHPSVSGDAKMAAKVIHI